eukprot:10015076-Ditylum_brightwellii.AAC.1
MGGMGEDNQHQAFLLNGNPSQQMLNFLQNGHTVGEVVADNHRLLSSMNGTLGVSTGFFYPHQMPEIHTDLRSMEPNVVSVTNENNAAIPQSVIDNIVALNPRA